MARHTSIRFGGITSFMVRFKGNSMTEKQMMFLSMGVITRVSQ